MEIEQVSPNSKNYMRGGTRIFVRRSTDPAGAMLHVGNIIGAPMSREQDVAEHVSGMSGTRTVDRRRVSVRALVYTVRTDESTFENYRNWMMGSAATTFTQDASTSESQTIGTITGCADGADVVVGRYYPLAKKMVSSLTVAGMTEYDNDAATGDYKIDYELGKIAFCRAVTTGELSGAVAYHCSALAGKSFTPFDASEIEVVCEGLRAMEDGDIHEMWTVPKARLEPSGDADITTENDRVMEFTLTQLKHPTSGWGTVTRWALAGS